MAFCRNCGVQIGDTDPFCRQCGMPSVKNPYAGYGGGTVVMVKPKVPGRGFGITAMILGIIGLAFGFGYMLFLPSYIELLDALGAFSYTERSMVVMTLIVSVVVYMPVPVLSLCFAPVAMKRGYKNGISKSGLITGAIGLLCYLITIILLLTYL